jgi:hypothetical protein
MRHDTSLSHIVSQSRSSIRKNMTGTEITVKVTGTSQRGNHKSLVTKTGMKSVTKKIGTKRRSVKR